MSQPESRVSCPHCAEPVALAARLCPHCRQGLLVDLRLAGPLPSGREAYAAARALEALGAGIAFLEAKRVLDSGTGVLLSATTRELASRCEQIVAEHGGLAEVGAHAPASGSDREAEGSHGGRRGRPAVAAAAALAALALVTLWLLSGRNSESPLLSAFEPAGREVGAQELSARQIAALAAPATVSLRCGATLGSGFFVAAERLITNAHVLCDDDELVIVGTGGSELRGVVESRDDWLDVALVRVAGASATPLPLGDASSLEQGETVYFYGSPRGLDLTLSQGIVSHPSRVLHGITYVQIDANVNPGNSGGPLITDKGEVVGVVTMVVGEGSGLGLAVPVNYLFEGDRPLLARPLSADTEAWRDRLHTASSQDAREVARVVESLERPVLAAAFLPVGRQPFALVIRLSAHQPWTEAFQFRLARGEETVCHPHGETLRWESLESGDAEWLDDRTRLWLERHAVEISAWGAMVPLEWDGCPRPSEALGLDLVLAEADPAWRRAPFQPMLPGF
jgi:serine protease Do